MEEDFYIVVVEPPVQLCFGGIPSMKLVEGFENARNLVNAAYDNGCRGYKVRYSDFLKLEKV